MIQIIKDNNVTQYWLLFCDLIKSLDYLISFAR